MYSNVFEIKIFIPNYLCYFLFLFTFNLHNRLQACKRLPLSNSLLRDLLQAFNRFLYLWYVLIAYYTFVLKFQDITF